MFQKVMCTSTLREFWYLEWILRNRRFNKKKNIQLNTLICHIFEINSYNLTVDVPSYCQANPDSVIEDISSCNRFYNCSQLSPGIHVVSLECSYPDLFSAVSRSCQAFASVKCHIRPEPMAPCKLLDIELYVKIWHKFCLSSAVVLKNHKDKWKSSLYYNVLQFLFTFYF